MDSDNDISTSHNLDFEVAESPYQFGGPYHQLFRIGTCVGQWGSTEDSYFIISIMNSRPGNGHLLDVFEWFEYSCKRDKKNLIILACINEKFYNHLLSKRGFSPMDIDKQNCIKIFNHKAYEQLLKDGNEIILPHSLKCI